MWEPRSCPVTRAEYVRQGEPDSGLPSFVVGAAVLISQARIEDRINQWRFHRSQRRTLKPSNGGSYHNSHTSQTSAGIFRAVVSKQSKMKQFSLLQEAFDKARYSSERPNRERRPSPLRNNEKSSPLSAQPGLILVQGIQPFADCPSTCRTKFPGGRYV